MICPLCHRAFDDPEQAFCVEDGELLVEGPAIQRVTPRDAAAVGTVLADRYVIKGLLGWGGLARVYLAEDTQTRELVAVKVLDAEQVQSRAVRERFLREVEIASRIGHPNIARILGSGQGPDLAPFIVVEYLVGESLGALLAREGRVPLDFALLLVKKAASALATAHLSGVVHRDVKPDNLFLVRDGSVLKVFDFGMAKLQAAAFTATGMTLGTVPYMAPEQAMADPVDGRTDVYGLGITLFKMLTGRLPFDTPDDTLLVAQHLYAPLPRPGAFLPGLDPRVERLILAATRKRPENRYPSMRAFLEDVGRLLGERPGDMECPPVTVEPDLYVPQNPIARSATRHLRALVG